MKLVLALCLTLLAGAVRSQQALQADAVPLVCTFHPCFRAQPLVLEDKLYETPAGERLTIETFRCYLSQVTLLHNGAVAWAEDNSYHLLNAAMPASLILTLPVPKDVAYDAIRFSLGIDSITSTAGAKGGDLDPTQGMYWTWNSGYINLKLEGSSPACTTRQNRFQYHLGGYSGSFNALQTVTLPVAAGSGGVHIKADVAKLAEHLELRSQPNIMSPGPEAVRLSKTATLMFYVEAGL